MTTGTRTQGCVADRGENLASRRSPFLFMWPSDTSAALTEFYGRHVLGPDGMPTPRWEAVNLVLIATPYPMRLSWDLAQTVTRIRCHRLVAQSLTAILTDIFAWCGHDLARVKSERMDLYGGCYNYRLIRGSHRISTHAWGAGIDLDPVHNRLGRKHKDGMMPLEVVQIFESYQWTAGMRFKRPDCMHFEATSGR